MSTRGTSAVTNTPSRQLTEAFPFSQGKNGGLSAPVDFQRFLSNEGRYAAPTDATIIDKSRVLLPEYLRTGQFGEFTGEKGVPIRYAVYGPPPGVPVKGVINLVTGRTESFAKYAETLYALRDLRAQGYVVASMDHRGQGFSGRELEPSDKGHVVDFEDFVRDEKTFTSLLKERFGANVPSTFLAHSMGGAIATRYLQEHRGDYERAVLLSPMLNIESGYPDVVESALATLGGVLAPTHYALKQKPFRPDDFATNKVTNSPARLQVQNELFERYPQLQLGGATWGWMRQAVDATRTIMKPSELDKLKGVDVHVLRATADQYVQTDTEDAFAKRLGLTARGYDFIDEQGIKRGTKHELLFHSDDVRTRVLADVRALLVR